ncbi:MAG: alpha/beta fold hydrolase [Myxococcales bacterium]
MTDEIVVGAWTKVHARFDTTMKGALPPDKLAAAWASVTGTTGAFRNVRRAVVTESASFHVVVLTCRFEKADFDVKVAFDGEARIAGLFFTSTPREVSAWQPPPYGKAAVDERAVTVGPLNLPGTLMLPRGAGPWPAVVLVHGSGPQDEDETIGASKPFRDLALGLAGHGVASLRYVKRTKHAPGDFAPPKKFTLKEETVDDARAAVALLAGAPGVDGKRIFVIGHSMGGYLAPRIADGEARVAGIVILAGSTRPLEDIVVEQMSRLAPVRVAQAEAEARAVRDPKLTDDAVVDFLGSKLPGSYFLDMRRYQPAATAARLEIPILVMQGERDFQVGSADYDGWANALGGHRNATLKLYPKLNHLFQMGDRPSRPDEYIEPGHHVDEQVIRDIAAFVTGKR